jgi:hypothetical protein
MHAYAIMRICVCVRTCMCAQHFLWEGFQVNLQCTSVRSAKRAALMTRCRALMSASLASLAILGFSAANAQTLGTSNPPPGSITAEQAAQDVRILRRALLDLHPGRTKYQTEDAWKANLAQFETRGNAARTKMEMYLAATAFTASLKCGHTWTNNFNQKGEVKKALLEADNKLPFTMTLVESRWLVLASADAAIRKGDEVISINGLDAAAIQKLVWPYLRADGASDEKRLRQLSHDRTDASQMDVTFPLLSPPAAGEYAVIVKRDGKDQATRVKATSLDARRRAIVSQGIAPKNEAWSLTINDGRAVMRLPTFAFFNGKFDWKPWLSNAFAEIAAKNVRELVVDIRDLEGGDDRIGVELMSFLLREPFRYTSDQAVTAYERVPYELARYLETWDYSFFDRTGQVERIGAGPQQGLFVVKPRVRGERTITPAAGAFKGRTYLLVSGENSSAGFQLAWLAQQARAAILIGQPTGGNLRGLNGGQLTWVTLPNSSVSVDIPLLAHIYAADTPDKSVVPDIVVPRTFEGLREGRDEEMAAVARAPR